MPRRAWLYAALLLPRLLRLAFPRVAFSDSAYLDAAARISHGQTPYRDFVHPQTPLPEYVLGTLERLFGTSHRVAEIQTSILVLTSTLLLLHLGRRRFGEAVAVCAAVLFAWHPFLLLVHVFPREIWVVAAALGAMLAPSLPWLVSLGAAGFLAKPTFLLFALAFTLARPRAGLGVLAGCALGLGLCLLLFGHAFFLQAILFHLLKGRQQGALAYGRVVLLHAPLLLPAALAGVGAARREAVAPLWLAAVLAFLVFGSPTVWEHNFIELLPPAALCAAAGGVWLWRRSRTGMALGVAAAGAVALHYAPQQDPAYWIGLSGVPRAELGRVRQAIQTRVGSDQEILAPLEVAAEADRRTPIHYPEVEGLMAQAAEAARTGQLGALMHVTRRLGFVGLANRSRAVWRPLVEAALARGEIAVVVLDDTQAASLPGLQVVRVSPAALVRRGFHVVLETPQYSVFTPGVRR